MKTPVATLSKSYTEDMSCSAGPFHYVIIILSGLVGVISLVLFFVCLAVCRPKHLRWYIYRYCNWLLVMEKESSQDNLDGLVFDAFVSYA